MEIHKVVLLPYPNHSARLAHLVHVSATQQNDTSHFALLSAKNNAPPALAAPLSPASIFVPSKNTTIQNIAQTEGEGITMHKTIHRPVKVKGALRSTPCANSRGHHASHAASPCHLHQKDFHFP